MRGSWEVLCMNRPGALLHPQASRPQASRQPLRPGNCAREGYGVGSEVRGVQQQNRQDQLITTIIMTAAWQIIVVPAKWPVRHSPGVGDSEESGKETFAKISPRDRRRVKHDDDALQPTPPEEPCDGFHQPWPIPNCKMIFRTTQPSRPGQPSPQKLSHPDAASSTGDRSTSSLTSGLHSLCTAFCLAALPLLAFDRGRWLPEVRTTTDHQVRLQALAPPLLSMAIMRYNPRGHGLGRLRSSWQKSESYSRTPYWPFQKPA